MVNRRVTESVVLTGNYRLRDQISTRALILGGDEYGIRIADLLKRNGFETTLLVDPKDRLPVSPTFETIQGVIKNVDGFIGDFQIEIQTSEGPRDTRCGFIIAAQPADKLSKTNLFISGGSEKIYSFSQFKQFLDSGGKLSSKENGGWLHVAFFFDLGASSEISQFDTLLSILDRLEMFDQIQLYVFTRNVKVASTGLEARFRYHRQHGVVFFKFDQAKPLIVKNEKGLIIEFVEPLLKEEMELEPDIVVIDEILRPKNSLNPILKIIPSSPVCAPYLQPESTRFRGVETLKAGIYAVGPARGAFDQESLDADVEAVRVSVLKAADNLSSPVFKQTAFIDHDKCVFCLTCFRLCPHGAIGFDFRPKVDPLSCESCGICVTECPMSAIQMRCGGNTVYSAQTEEPPGKKNTGQTGKIKLFVCSKSGLQAAAKIDPNFLNDVEVFELSCAGSLDPDFLLKVFREGAEGVVVAGCFKGNCGSVYGSTLAYERVAKMTRILEQAQLDARNLEFIFVAGNTPEPVIDAITRVRNRNKNKE
ncbi:MAG: hydrogenase iron-sulfur subunit [Desulfomonilaceae bacterium]